MIDGHVRERRALGSNPRLDVEALNVDLLNRRVRASHAVPADLVHRPEQLDEVLLRIPELDAQLAARPSLRVLWISMPSWPQSFCCAGYRKGVADGSVPIGAFSWSIGAVSGTVTVNGAALVVGQSVSGGGYSGSTLGTAIPYTITAGSALVAYDAAS